jgi:hypothetical protein
LPICWGVKVEGGPGSLAAWQGLLDNSLLGGPAAPARTATGGEPLPKPVSYNKETAAICVVRDRLPEGSSGALLAPLALRELLARHEGGQHRVPDNFRGDDHLRDVIATGNVVHDIEQYFLKDGPQTSGARTAQ